MCLVGDWGQEIYMVSLGYCVIPESKETVKGYWEPNWRDSHWVTTRQHEH